MATERLQSAVLRLLSVLHVAPATLHTIATQHPLRSSAVLGALVIVLRFALARQHSTKQKITDFGRFACRLSDSSEVHSRQPYDIVVVGGGTAGCVLASRLSENPVVRVLLLEAGSSSVHNPLSRVPLLYGQFFHTGYDYDLYTVPQEHAASKRKYWPRGRMLGGCSSMNAMIFHHGAPPDFDQWAEMQKGQDGADGWRYENFSKYFHKFEKFHPSKSFSLVDVALRGSAGPVHVGYFGKASEGTMLFLRACHNAGIEHNPDFNTSKGTLGSSKTMTFIDSQVRRVTTQSAYLTPEVLARPNLTVATRATVTRIVFDTHEGQVPRVVGVQFKDRKGELFEVKARQEVVLSAGAVHTPQILMLSGIGPADHLSSFNIPVVQDLPGVGAHLMDHPVVDFHFRDKTKALMSKLSHNRRSLAALARQMAYFLQYRLTATGPLTTNVAEAAAFLRSDDASLFAKAGMTLPTPDDLEDATSGPGAPDIEIFFTPMSYLEHGQADLPEGHHFGVHAVLLRPTSTGTVRLKSTDPSDAPIIDPLYLCTSHDIRALVRAVRIIAHITHTRPLSAMLDPSGSVDATGLLNHDLASKTDAQIEEVVRERVETLYHPTSTARMAPREDGGAVDPYLRVYGVKGLRVCDASVFPTISSGHTASPTIAIAEKGADMISEALRS